jgi:DNA-binding NarL/FixJ family response regulator
LELLPNRGKTLERREQPREMLTVETVLKVRLARRDGQSVRKIAKKHRLSRNTVRKYLRGEEVEPRVPVT